MGSASAKRIGWISVLGAEEVAAAAESRLNFAVGAGNDVGCHEAVADALASISTSANSCVHSTGFAAHQNGDVAAADEFTTDQARLGGLGHGVSRFDRGDQAAGFDHAEGNAHGFSCYCQLQKEAEVLG